MILPFVSLLPFVLGVVVHAEDNVVNVGSLSVKPYTSLSSSGEHEGFIVDLLEKIFDKKKDYKINIMEDGNYGAKIDEDNWSGLIGKLTRQEIDLAAAPLTVTKQRQEAVTFTKPFMTFNFAALMTRALQVNKSINSFDDLVKHNDVRLGVLKSGATYSFFEGAQKDIYKKMFEKMENSPTVVRTTEEGVKKVRHADDKFVFIMESPTAKYIANKSPCDLAVIESQGEEVKYAFAVKKNDEKLKKKVNDKLLEHIENGDLWMIEKKWWKQDCSSAIRGTSTNLGFLFAAFLVRFLF